MIDPAKCYGCGTRVQEEDIYVPETAIWFHSEPCYFREIEKRRPKRYGSIGDPEAPDKDPDVKAAWENHLEALRDSVEAYRMFKKLSREDYDEWCKTLPTFKQYKEAEAQYWRDSRAAGKKAQQELHAHIQAEWKHYQLMEQYKAAQQEEKEAEQIIREGEKRLARLEKMGEELDELQRENRVEMEEQKKWIPKPFDI